MPVTETEHEQRIERQREYRETSEPPTDHVHKPEFCWWCMNLRKLVAK